MAIMFTGRTKQARLDLAPSVAYAFLDYRAEECFTRAGFADPTDEDPTVTYPVGSLKIDPETTFAGTTTRVLED